MYFVLIAMFGPLKFFLTSFLRSNIYKALNFFISFLKFSILGPGRDLASRGILHAEYLPLSHKKGTLHSCIERCYLLPRYRSFCVSA